MKTRCLTLFATAASLVALAAQEISLESAPPVVVSTSPVAGSTNVNPGLTEIRVTFSKPMRNNGWSWATLTGESFPETTGKPFYRSDERTCVLPVKLLPGKLYALWLNSENAKNFTDAAGRSAVPYLLTFTTAASTPPPPGADIFNADQRAVMEWTDRQFRSYFDNRTFEALSDQERTELETRLLDSLKGPEDREYYQAINTLAALRSPKALAALREIAFSPLDKNNRDRWMAVRGLGLAGDTSAVPGMIHLVYHGNTNTRWWAQISLVRLTGQNFGTDWKAWRDWWNSSGGTPPCPSEIIRWWEGQASPEELPAVLAESDRKFLSGLKPQ